MSTQERTELLKQVAECAPKEWESPHGFDTWDSGVLRFDVPNEPGSVSCYLRLVGDIHDAEAIIAMLDAMEAAGLAIHLHAYTPGDREYRIEWWKDLRDVRDNPDRCAFGATRAEAASKAFVAVFGGGK